MDHGDALPPPIRRSPRATLERQVALQHASLQHAEHDAAAPVMPRRRSASLKNGPPPSRERSRTNPLASHPVTIDSSPGLTDFARHKFSHPFWEELRPFVVEKSKPPAPIAPRVVAPPLLAPLVPHRSPAGLKSFRSNKRLPLHLRQRTSLETIASVTTTQSIASDEDEADPPEASAPSPYLFTLEDDATATPVPPDAPSLASSTHLSSVSLQYSAKPTITPLNSRESEPHSPKSLFQKMTRRKQSESSALPDRLVIERKISFDRTSHRSSLGGSKESLPLEGPSSPGLFNTGCSQSSSSSEWSASNFDISALSEAEIKKCKKQGINPALFAEMKAARKGKWASPIAGNTFLRHKCKYGMRPLVIEEMVKDMIDEDEETCICKNRNAQIACGQVLEKHRPRSREYHRRASGSSLHFKKPLQSSNYAGVRLMTPIVSTYRTSCAGLLCSHEDP
ncbi:hypothetical protein BDU57DRAFT_66984 [Ampelomyces quisqualis]|uniref:Uncharacterized protein n=1 Tax=Ampelomyces quisqualis TaxID=50730 RepID=A0A6A5R3F9_AMPQU|nr:hypothetical protein BDU57DRAFT_66984 [Ampelomyces quisqualis]